MTSYREGPASGPSSNSNQQIRLRLRLLNEVISRLLGSKHDPSSLRLIYAVRRILRQFHLDHRFSASDIFIEAYLRTHLNIQEGRVIDNLPGWIYKVSLNIIREHSRQCIKDRQFIFDAAYELTNYSHINSSLDLVEEKSVLLLVEALEKLSDLDREILSLRNGRGLSWQKIREHFLHSQQREFSTTTLRKKGERALKRLRKVFLPITHLDQEESRV